VNVLITGAGGFLGRALVRAAREEGLNVRALTRKPDPPFADSGVEHVVGDLVDPALAQRAVAGMSAVIHAAARVSTTGRWEEFAEVNVRATARLLQAARVAGVQRFVHISSLSVFDVPADGSVITSESPYERESRARGHYSRSKLAADRLALWEARHGAPVVVLRPGLLFGPGRQPPLARQVVPWKRWRLLLARRDYPLPLSHVDSVARAALLALSAGDHVLGRAYTIVDAHVPQVLMVEEQKQALAADWRAVYLPVRLIALLVRVGERGLALVGRRSPVSYHQVCRATFRAFYDCSDAVRDLGWRPREQWREDVRASIASLPAVG
jgi:nucleoside-diphosphate-sugar epimerase